MKNNKSKTVPGDSGRLLFQHQPVEEINDRTRAADSAWYKWSDDLTILKDFVRMKKEFVIVLSPPHPKNLAIDHERSLEILVDSVPGLVIELRGYLDSQDIS